MQIPVTTSGRIHSYHPNMRPRLSFRRRWFRRMGFYPAISLFTLLVLAERNVSAQQSAILTNNGQPMRVAYGCAEEDLEWAGLSCTDDQPCAIFFEPASVIPDGKKIFLAGNLHSNSATLASVLLLSDDSGGTWKEPAARIRGSALEQVQFYNLQAGWVAGETQYPLPRDPFFLMTTDGGASWQQHLVGEEGAAGSSQRFWFDSGQHGELIIDAGKTSASGRYLLYESQTGGENWNLLGKSDQMPKLRRAPPSLENSDWRFRPGKDGKSFQIEQRAANEWMPVASFLIEVANCRIQSGELKEPEAPAEPAAPSPAAPDPKQKRKK
jgi:hypothetical protein